MRATPATVVTGVTAAVVLATGVATAVSRAHHDRVAALPPVCRDTVGTTGGALPDGRLLDLALGNVLRDGSSGAPRSLAQQGGPAAFGPGTPAEIEARAKALTGAGGGAPAGAATRGRAGSAPPSVEPRQGDQHGGGGGAAGPGGAGTGNGSGPSSGPGGGVGTQPQTGSGAGGQSGAPLPAVVPPREHTQPLAEPGGAHHRDAGWLVLVGATAALALAYGVWRARRRRRRRAGDDAVEADLDAAAATARAREAWRRNDLDAALRWTFVAGLLRLDDAGVMPYDPTRTTRAISRRLRSRLFTDLATVFDRVAYGGRPATEADVDGAVRGWELLLVEVKRS